MSEPIDVRDDGAHEHGGAPGWRERLSFNFFDASSGFGGVASVEFRPGDKTADGTLTLFVPGGAVATVLARETVDGTAASSAGRLRLDRYEPLARWRVRCRDVALVFPKAGAVGLPKKGERSGAAAQLDLDLMFEAWVPPSGTVERAKAVDELGFVQVVSSGHFEQAGRYSGKIRLGARAATLEAGGVRDRSWGPRNETASHGSCWLAIPFGPTLALGIRAVTIGERGMHSGWVAADGETRAVASVHLETEYEGRTCTALTARVEDSSGERYEIAGEALMTVPLNDGRARVQQTMMRFRWKDRETVGLGEFVLGS